MPSDDTCKYKNRKISAWEAKQVRENTPRSKWNTLPFFCLHCDGRVKPHIGKSNKPHFEHWPGENHNCPIRHKPRTGQGNRRKIAHKDMRSIQEIFSEEFVDATLAVIQKIRPDERNLNALQSGFTESWPPLPPDRPADVFVLAIEEKDDNKRQEIWAGFINDCQPSTEHRFRFYVDRFRLVGEHNLAAVSDAAFYGHGGGGGSRNYAFNSSQAKRKSATQPLDREVPNSEGENELRLVWVRKNHGKFRDPVWRHWEGKCAVTGADCNGLLVASHIHPWAKSTPKEKTDPNNGLLLSVPLDKLFDRGWISFSDAGTMLIKPLLSQQTQNLFGLKRSMGLKMNKVSVEMLEYIARHRAFHGFD